MVAKAIPTPPILENLFSDIGEEPEWRGRAAKEKAWQDSYQWSKKQIQNFRDLGLPENMFVNFMAPAMDSVTGLEAQNRVDWMLTASDEGQDDMVEAINHKFNDNMRLTDANTACSDAYGSQASVGVGWVHVGKNPDILAPSKIIVENIHRDEMFWDMRSRSGNLKTDCRWIARRRFLDKDTAHAFFPCNKELIDFTWSDWQTIDINPSGVMSDWYTQLNDYTEVVEDYMDNVSARKRIAIYETYYKVFENSDIIITQDGIIQEFNELNPVHMEMLLTGQARIHTNVPVNVTREAWFIGPNCVHDCRSRAPHNDFPYVPFFGVREDSANTPQGLLRRMMGPQEEYNRAVVEIQRILRTRRIQKDENATLGMTDQQVVHEVNRADGVINMTRGSRFEVIREWEKIAALEGICARARDEVNAASGIYQTFQGKTEASQSGVAVENIAALGVQTLGKINANHQVSRKMVGDLVFAYTVDEMGTSPLTINIPQSLGHAKRSVKLNDGLSNRVSMLRASVGMQDVHTSSGYKQHTNQRLTTVMAGLPDDLKSTLLPLWIESADIPKKEFALKLIHKKLGYTDDEEQQAQMEQAEQQRAEEARQVELGKIQAETAEKNSSAAENEAQAENYKADASKKRAETVLLLQQIKAGRLAGSTTGKPTADPGKVAPSVAPGRNDVQANSAM